MYNLGDPQSINQQSYILQFADDNELVSHGKSLTETMENLQNLTDKTIFWMEKWRTTSNPNKSHLIIFNHKITNNSPTINLLQHTLQPSSSCKYLGINIDSKLNFNLQTKLCKQSILTRSRHFRNLTYKNEGIDTHTACKIYKMICRPILEYGFVLFGNCRKPALRNMEVGERSSMRKITKIRHPNNPLHNPSNHLLYQKTNIEPILSRLQTFKKICK